jgi:hypothetical protein
MDLDSQSARSKPSSSLDWSWFGGTVETRIGHGIGKKKEADNEERKSFGVVSPEPITQTG